MKPEVELSVGEHSVEWNLSSGLPSGMYECVIELNGQVETISIVLD
jgi:hypothetical protein